MDTVGPSFSASRVLRFGELPSDEQEAFTRFFCEQKVNVRRCSQWGGGAARGLERTPRRLAPRLLRAAAPRANTAP